MPLPSRQFQHMKFALVSLLFPYSVSTTISTAGAGLTPARLTPVDCTAKYRKLKNICPVLAQQRGCSPLAATFEKHLHHPLDFFYIMPRITGFPRYKKNRHLERIDYSRRQHR